MRRRVEHAFYGLPKNSGFGGHESGHDFTVCVRTRFAGRWWKQDASHRDKTSAVGAEEVSPALQRSLPSAFAPHQPGAPLIRGFGSGSVWISTGRSLSLRSLWTAVYPARYARTKCRKTGRNGRKSLDAPFPPKSSRRSENLAKSSPSSIVEMTTIIFAATLSPKSFDERSTVKNIDTLERRIRFAGRGAPTSLIRLCVFLGGAARG